MGDIRCSAAGCTVEGYGDSTTTVSGSIGISDPAGGGKHFVWHLTAKRGAGLWGDAPFDFVLDGDLTVSPTLVDGATGATWTGSETVEGHPATVTYGSRLRFDGISPATRCARSGTLTGKVWRIVRATGRPDQIHALQATHAFTGCSP
jgi:hypothetical protein